MCKQLNGPILKSFKTKLSGPKSEKALAGLGQNFVFRFGPGLARAEISISFGPGSD